MSNWQVTIEGNDEDIKQLERMLSDSPFNISSFEGEKVLEVPGVTPETDIDVAHMAASEFIETLNGVAKLYFPNFSAISYSKLLRLTDDGRRIGHYIIHANVGLYTASVNIPGDKTVSKWIQIARDNPEVARALHLYGLLESNWKNLYMILEVVEDDIGGETALIQTNLVEEKEIKLFKQTANSFGAVGHEARHSTLRFAPPAVPMKLQQAKTLISNLLKSWIEHKYL
jgi:hypothetical protein